MSVHFPHDMNAVAALPRRLVQQAAGLYRYAVLDSLRIAKKNGLRGLLRERGWRFVAGVCAYYLVRDTLIYVVLPLCAARGLW